MGNQNKDRLSAKGSKRSKERPERRTSPDYQSRNGGRSGRPPTATSDMSHSAPNTPAAGASRREMNALPPGRVKTIMKSSPDVETVSQESLFLITRATELFIMYLSKLASRNGGEDPSVTYADLAAVVQRKDSMEFLHDIVPKKIKYGEYLKIMQSEKGKHDDIF